MGGVTSKDTRRLSFNNSHSFDTSLDIETRIDTENDLHFGKIAKKKSKSGSVLYKNSDIISQDLPQEEAEYWNQRIENLKSGHQEINMIIEKEYEKSLEEYNFYSIPQVTHERIEKLKPCLELQSKIVKCYQDNPHQTLECSGLVQAFTESVNTSCNIDE